ncbi:hypothetical protein CANCADRAFT_13293, partial [Tortispora caseinolytica NRRL Y-17796]
KSLVPVKPIPKRLPKHAHPLNLVEEKNMTQLDPDNWKRTIFSRKNENAVRVKDIVRVSFADETPIVGAVMAIYRRGMSTTFRLRNRYTKIGTEMKIPLFSPLLKQIDVVQRSPKPAKLNKLFYLRHPKLDLGDVEGKL